MTERLFINSKFIDRKFGVCAMVNAKCCITLLKFYVRSFVRLDMRAPIVSIVLNTVKFARITTTINYAKLHCWRKVVMRLTVACVRFHFDLRRHGVPASRNARWQQRNSIRRLTLRGRRDFWCALTSVYDALIMLSFQERALIHWSPTAVGFRGVSKSKCRPHKWNIG